MRIKTFRQPSFAPHSARRARATFATAMLVAACTGNAWADEHLDPIGGPGGGQFEAHCPPNQFLAGFELRAADDVDAIRPLCVTASGPRETSAASDSDWHGGTGGASTYLVCPRDTPIVTGMHVAAEGMDTVIVNDITLSCGLAVDRRFRDSPLFPAIPPTVSFHAPRISPSRVDLYFYVATGDDARKTNGSQSCSYGQLAVGLHGRSGIWLDAVGLICGAPPDPGKTLGRVNTGTPLPSHPPGWTICDAARAALARNSPAAPNLVAQCAASAPAKSIGRVNAGASPPHPPGWTICDAARSARARNSPASPNLEAQCRAIGGTP